MQRANLTRRLTLHGRHVVMLAAHRLSRRVPPQTVGGLVARGYWRAPGRFLRPSRRVGNVRRCAVANHGVAGGHPVAPRGIRRPARHTVHTCAAAPAGDWAKRRGQSTSQSATPGGPSVKLRVQIDRVMFYAPDSGYTVARGRVLQESSDGAGADAGDSITMQGRGGVASLTEGAVVNVEGVWTTHAKYGRQLRVDSSSTAAPRTPEAVAQYVPARELHAGPPSHATAGC